MLRLRDLPADGPGAAAATVGVRAMTAHVAAAITAVRGDFIRFSSSEFGPTGWGPAGSGPVALVVDGRAVRQARHADHVGCQPQVCADQVVYALWQVWI